MSEVVLVGVAGSLGTLLSSALKVRGINLRHPGETLDAEVPELAMADVVVNVSGPRVRPGLGWADYLREHVGTASAIARSMRPGSHVIHFSSAAVWGARSGIIGAKTAESPISFPNPSYAWAKLAGEHAARAICGERGVGITVVRPAMVYGEGISSAIDTMFSLAKKGILVDLRPHAIKQHCLHVSLLCRAITALIDSGPTSRATLPLVDPFFFTNGELNAAVARKRRGLGLPVPLPLAETMLRRWPIFPDREGPGALAAFAFLGLDNEFDWHATFAALDLRAADFAKEKTLLPYLESFT